MLRYVFHSGPRVRAYAPPPHAHVPLTHVGRSKRHRHREYRGAVDGKRGRKSRGDRGIQETPGKRRFSTPPPPRHDHAVVLVDVLVVVVVVVVVAVAVVLLVDISSTQLLQRRQSVMRKRKIRKKLVFRDSFRHFFQRNTSLSLSLSSTRPISAITRIDKKKEKKKKKKEKMGI